jgi:hypothetical protein
MKSEMKSIPHKRAKGIPAFKVAEDGIFSWNKNIPQAKATK